MYNFTTTIRHESKAAPGVVFDVKRMAEGARLELRVKLADAFARLRAIDAERQDMIEEAAARLGKDWTAVLVSELTASERRTLRECTEREALVTDTEVNPAYLVAGLATLDGLQIDGAPAAPGDLARGPRELYREILAAVLAASGLAPEARPNSESPSTSGAVEDGATNDSTAPDASASSSTGSTIAPAA